MKLRVLGLVAALMMASPALAAWDVDAITQQFQADGFTRIEVKIGPTQAKVEAIKEGTKVEVIYDLATGDVLKRESEVISADDSSATGVFVRNTVRDFIGTASSGGSNDDDSADDNSGRDGSDDSVDDNGGNEPGDDNGGGNDDGPDHDSNDDHGGGSNSGSGSSGGDDDGDDTSDD